MLFFKKLTTIRGSVDTLYITANPSKWLGFYFFIFHVNSVVFFALDTFRAWFFITICLVFIFFS